MLPPTVDKYLPPGLQFHLKLSKKYVQNPNDTMLTTAKATLSLYDRMF